jgi:hypothetical protein
VFLRDVEHPCWAVPIDVEAKEVTGRSRVRAFELQHLKSSRADQLLQAMSWLST